MKNDRISKNSLNPKMGKEFEEKVSKILTERYSIKFETLAIPIGKPSKEHKFDLVSEDKKYIVECKCYSWTEGGNIPSAKMAILNEAVFYLSHVSKDKDRWIVMKKDFSIERQKTLARYYFQINQHLLDGVKIWEVDESGNISEIS